MPTRLDYARENVGIALMERQAADEHEYLLLQAVEWRVVEVQQTLSE